MTTYVYKCTNEDCKLHDVEVEIQQSMKDDPVKTCARCHEDTLVKVIQPNCIVFRGSGFPTNDSRK